MKNYKKIDAYISAVLITAFVVAAFFIKKEDGNNFDSFLFTGYFTVGGWQVLSMIVHEITKYNTANGSMRRNYHVIVLLIISITVLMLLFGFEASIAILACLLILSPFMAIFYTWLCFSEIKRMHRPIEILK